MAHDWGAAVGFQYVQLHMDTLDKYVMIGAAPLQVWHRQVTANLKQFLMSWYVFYFQMPILPEFSSSLNDFAIFDDMVHESEEDLEAYKYTFSKEGAMTGPLNHYRASIKFLFPNKQIPRPTSFVPGLVLVGESDPYTSRNSIEKALKIIDKLEFGIIKGGNHFAQQNAPAETNRLIRQFIEKK